MCLYTHANIPNICIVWLPKTHTWMDSMCLEKMQQKQQYHRTEQHEKIPQVLPVYCLHRAVFFNGFSRYLRVYLCFKHTKKYVHTAHSHVAFVQWLWHCRRVLICTSFSQCSHRHRAMQSRSQTSMHKCLLCRFDNGVCTPKIKYRARVYRTMHGRSQAFIFLGFWGRGGLGDASQILTKIRWHFCRK